MRSPRPLDSTAEGFSRREGVHLLPEVREEMAPPPREEGVEDVTPDEAINAIYAGQIVKVTKEEYLYSVRSAIQDQAGIWLDQGDAFRSMIALNEVARLDKLYPPFGDEPAVTSFQKRNEEQISRLRSKIRG